MPRGRPTVLSEKTTAGADSALAVLTPRALRTSYGELVRMALHQITEPMVVVVDAMLGRVYATTDLGTGSAWNVLVVGSGTSAIVVQPDEAKFLCHWSIIDQATWIRDEADWFHPNNRRSTQAAIDHLIASGAQQIILSQNSGTMRAVLDGNGVITVQMDSIQGQGDCWCWQLSEVPRTGLIFE